MATARSGTTDPPRPEPPTPAGLRRPRSLPDQPEGPLPPPRRLSPLTPPPQRDPPTPGTPPGTGTPPALLAAAADLRGLTKRWAGGERGAAGPGPPRLPPLVAALTRRTGATERPRQLRSPTPPRGLPPPPRPPGLCPSAAPVPPPPGRSFPDAVTLRPHPALCGDEDTGGHGAPEPLSLREIYRELCRALPAERLRFDGDPAVEPAAAALDLVPPEPRVAAPPPPRREPPAGLFARYLRHVAATGSDFLRATFHHAPGDAAAAEPHREPAPPPAPPYEEGQWRPVQPDPAELQPLQRRLNRLWAALDVPADERSAMALKYGAAAATRLPAALAAWEAAAAAVVRRERLLARLERLESGGSDPARFSAPATRGCGESRRCERALRRCEARVRRELRRLRGAFGDTATLRGRPYEHKMRRDAVEMRYALRQRRRAAVLLGGPPPNPPPGDAATAGE